MISQRYTRDKNGGDTIEGMKVRDFFILFVLPDRRWLGREVKTSLSVGVITVGMKNEMNLNEEQGVAHPRRRIYSES